MSIAVVQPFKNDLKLVSPSLQSAGLWYLGVPEPCLNLNEHSYLQPETHTGDVHWPLFWIHFGGPGGMYLRHLTGIEVHSNGSITGIHFQYDTDDVPSEYRRLGRHSCSNSLCHRPMRFTIDGPGGEHITGIEIGCEVVPLDSDDFRQPYGQNCLNSLTVRHTNRLFTSRNRYQYSLWTRGTNITRHGQTFTNFGRSFKFHVETHNPYQDPNTKEWTKRIDVEKGEKITGFYAALVCSTPMSTVSLPYLFNETKHY